MALKFVSASKEFMRLKYMIIRIEKMTADDSL
jgi:hypothetical protein